MELTHRERVKLALNHEEPDRVPLDLCGGTTNMVDPVYFKVKEKLGIKEDIKPYRSGKTCTYYDERVLEALDIDFRHIRLSSPKSFTKKTLSDGSFYTEWGAIVRKEGNFVEPVEPTIKEATVEAVEKHSWPNTEDKTRMEGVVERAKHLYENTDYAISTKFIGGGFLDYGGNLRGFENFMMDMAMNEDFVNAFMDKILEVKTKLYEMMLKEIGDYVQMVELAEDFGTQNSLFISPDMFRKYIKPRYTKLIGRIKEIAPETKVFFHTCGAIRPIIGDLEEAGVDVLNPLQPLAKGIEPGEIKEEYGSKLAFHGAIDIQESLPGDVEEVKEEVATRVKQLAKGGGYILAPTNHIQSDTPAENVVALFEYARKVGKYPIDL